MQPARRHQADRHAGRFPWTNVAVVARWRIRPVQRLVRHGFHATRRLETFRRWHCQQQNKQCAVRTGISDGASQRGRERHRAQSCLQLVVMRSCGGASVSIEPSRNALKLSRDGAPHPRHTNRNALKATLNQCRLSSRTRSGPEISSRTAMCHVLRASAIPGLRSEENVI